jgi:hypothetical protein
MTKPLVVGMAAGVLLCHSALSFAGLTFKQVTTTDGKPSSVTQVWSDGGQAKTETLESAIDNPFMPPGSYLLVNEQEMLLVNPAAGTFARFDVGAMMQNVQGMANGIEITDVKVEKVLDEPGESIAGYPTRHYQFKSSWSMGFNGMPVKTEMNLVEDLWATDAIDLPAGAPGAAGAMPDSIARLAEAQAQRQVEGFTLRHVTVQSSKSSMMGGGLGGGLGGRMAQRMMGGAGAGSATTTSIEVLDIEEADIPAATFAIPAGYRETSLLQSGPALPGLNDVEEAPNVPNLNNLDN